MGVFAISFRIYYEDTDAGGVVYHANYLKFIERARTDFLRSLGFEQDQLRDELGVLFVVKHMELDFKRAVKFNQVIEATASVIKIAGVRLFFEQKIRDSSTDIDYFYSKVEVVCVKSSTFRPTAIPTDIIQAIQDAS